MVIYHISGQNRRTIVQNPSTKSIYGTYPQNPFRNTVLLPMSLQPPEEKGAGHSGLFEHEAPFFLAHSLLHFPERLPWTTPPLPIIRLFHSSPFSLSLPSPNPPSSLTLSYPPHTHPPTLHTHTHCGPGSERGITGINTSFHP